MTCKEIKRVRAFSFEAQVIRREVGAETVHVTNKKGKKKHDRAMGAAN